MSTPDYLPEYHNVSCHSKYLSNANCSGPSWEKQTDFKLIDQAASLYHEPQVLQRCSHSHFA